MKYMIIFSAFYLVLEVHSALAQVNYGNYITFNRGLPLEEVIDNVQISMGSSVWIIDPADPQTTLARITPEETGSSLMPSWDPGKTRIVFATNRENQGATPLLDIWTVAVDGSDLRRLTQNAGHNWTPAWSPDGSKIAFASTRNRPTEPDPVSYFDIFVMNADGSDQRFLADAGLQDEDPVFSADGQTVYFVAERNECYQVWQVPSDSGGATPLLDNDNNFICGEDMSLSPDGQTLFFWSNSTGQFAGFNLQTSEIIYYSYDSFEPWIGPSGEHFVYMSNCNNFNCDIFTSDLEGNNVVQVTSGGQDFFPRWAGPLDGISTSVNHFKPGEIPDAFTLYQNYPNPFNPSTTIKFSLPEPSEVILKIFDIQGGYIVTLLQESRKAGLHIITVEASHLPTGVYFYQIHVKSSLNSTKSFMSSRKFILLK